jgi:hypothetical protein
MEFLQSSSMPSGGNVDRRKTHIRFTVNLVVGPRRREPMKDVV